MKKQVKPFEVGSTVYYVDAFKDEPIALVIESAQQKGRTDIYDYIASSSEEKNIKFSGELEGSIIFETYESAVAAIPKVRCRKLITLADKAHKTQKVAREAFGELKRGLEFIGISDSLSDKIIKCLDDESFDLTVKDSIMRELMSDADTE